MTESNLREVYRTEPISSYGNHGSRDWATKTWTVYYDDGSAKTFTEETVDEYTGGMWGVESKSLSVVEFEPDTYKWATWGWLSYNQQQPETIGNACHLTHDDTLKYHETLNLIGLYTTRFFEVIPQQVKHQVVENEKRIAKKHAAEKRKADKQFLKQQAAERLKTLKVKPQQAKTAQS